MRPIYKRNSTSNVIIFMLSYFIPIETKGRLNINMSCYRYRDSRVMALQSSYIQHGNLGKTVLILRRGPEKMAGPDELNVLIAIWVILRLINFQCSRGLQAKHFTQVHISCPSKHDGSLWFDWWVPYFTANEPETYRQAILYNSWSYSIQNSCPMGLLPDT